MCVGCAVGVFVTLTMAMSTLSVITTVLVLYLHHSTWIYPVPRWVHTLAFTILARALCMRLPVTPHTSISDQRDPRSSEVLQMTSSQPEVGDNCVKMASHGRAVNCFRCTANFDEILAQLRKVYTANRAFKIFYRATHCVVCRRCMCCRIYVCLTSDTAIYCV